MPLAQSLGSLLLCGWLIPVLTLPVAASSGGPGDLLPSTIPEIVISPGGQMPYQTTIRGRDGVLPGITVEIVFHPRARELLCLCAGTAEPIQAISDSEGHATFFLAGGGCLDPETAGLPWVAQVFAAGILLNEVGVVSPDAVDVNGVLPADGWILGSDCEPGLPDAVFHTVALASGDYQYCSDFDSDGEVTLADAVLVTPALGTGASCSR